MQKACMTCVGLGLAALRGPRYHSIAPPPLFAFCQSATLLTSSIVSVWPQHSGGTSTPVTILPLKPVPTSRSRYACAHHTQRCVAMVLA